MTKKILLIVGAVAVIFLLAFFVNRYLFAKWAFRFVEQADVQWMGFTERKIVALTFDDGPDPRFTPKIMDILKQYRIPATFFLVGNNVEKYPEIVRQEIEGGFEIGNHTLSHPRLSTLDREEVMRQIGAAEERIYKAVGVHTLIFRPPYEELNGSIIASARDLHQQVILSTITLEHGNKKKPAKEADRVLKNIFPGAIILAHDGRLDRSYTIAALPRLIQGLKAKGYRVVPLRKLLHY